jgi:hypothetical protein
LCQFHRLRRAGVVGVVNRFADGAADDRADLRIRRDWPAERLASLHHHALGKRDPLQSPRWRTFDLPLR